MEEDLSISIDNHRTLWLTEISRSTFDDQALDDLGGDGGVFVVLEDCANGKFDVLAKATSKWAGEILLELLAQSTLKRLCQEPTTHIRAAMHDDLRDAIELAKIGAGKGGYRNYPGCGGIWAGQNNGIADGNFTDWGLGRAVARILNAAISGELTDRTSHEKKPPPG